MSSVSVSISVSSKGEGGESTTGSDLLLVVRVFCRGEDGVGGGGFAGGNLARKG